MCSGALSVGSHGHNVSNGICFAHRRASRREFPPPISTGPALHIRGWHSPTPIGRGAGDEAHIVGHRRKSGVMLVSAYTRGHTA
jgi:hypothetical protein